MKKTLQFGLFLLFSFMAFGQISLGVKGGLNLAHQRINFNGNGATISETGSTIPTFQLGFFAKAPLGKQVTFVPEILLSGSGANFPGADSNGNRIQVRIRPFYLRVPLDVEYETAIKGGSRIFGGAGPEFGYGLFGKAYQGSVSGDAFQSDGFRRFDFGINFVAGIELQSGVRLGVNYYLGIASIITSSANSALGGVNTSWYNRELVFSVGYLFHRK
ncbi:MAG TPA: porin family protein [Puia sp.]|nr:porin family protein [Puia sp.]